MVVVACPQPNESVPCPPLFLLFTAFTPHDDSRDAINDTWLLESVRSGSFLFISSSPTQNNNKKTKKKRGIEPYVAASLSDAMPRSWPRVYRFSSKYLVLPDCINQTASLILIGPLSLHLYRLEARARRERERGEARTKGITKGDRLNKSVPVPSRPVLCCAVLCLRLIIHSRNAIQPRTLIITRPNDAA